MVGEMVRARSWSECNRVTLGRAKTDHVLTLSGEPRESKYAARTAEKTNDVIRFLKSLEEDSKSAAGEAAHGQTTEEPTRHTQAPPQSPVRTQELSVPIRPEATHPQRITVLGREPSPQLEDWDQLMSVSYRNWQGTYGLYVFLFHIHIINQKHLLTRKVHSNNTFYFPEPHYQTREHNRGNTYLPRGKEHGIVIKF